MKKLKKGFTLLEILVATMLLAMLVTILTMIFNQSSIAWTVGTASVVGLGDAREKISQYSIAAENAIVRSDGNVVNVVSVWDDSGSGIRQGDARTLSNNSTGVSIQSSDISDPFNASSISIGSAASAGRDSYVVGVTSKGANESDVWDDITTMPEEVVK